MANTCANLTNKTIKIPDNCGKLSLNDLKNNWLAVRAIFEFLIGFLGFKIPGKLQKQVFSVNGSNNIIISNLDWEDNTIVFTLPVDNFAYGFYMVYINGLERPGGTPDGGANAFTLEYAWKVELVGSDYVLTFLDEDLNPVELGGDGQPDTVTVVFRPMLTIGTYFCTTNGSPAQTIEGCKC